MLHVYFKPHNESLKGCMLCYHHLKMRTLRLRKVKQFAKISQLLSGRASIKILDARCYFLDEEVEIQRAKWVNCQNCSRIQVSWCLVLIFLKLLSLTKTCHWVPSFIQQVFIVQLPNTQDYARHWAHSGRQQGWVLLLTSLVGAAPLGVSWGTHSCDWEGWWVARGGQSLLCRGCREEQDLAGKPGLSGVGPVRNSRVGERDALGPQHMLLLLTAKTCASG